MRLNSFADSPRLLQFYKKIWKNFEIILFFENVLSMSLLKAKSKPKDQSSNQNKQKKVWSYLAISRGVATGKGQGAMLPPPPPPSPPSHFSFQTSISGPSEKFLSVDHPKEDHKEREFKP